jgi:ATPase inhibitor, mitochondrial
VANHTISINSDAFQRRERASEDYAIKQREKEKLLELRKKLAEQQAHLKQLSDHMLVEPARF